MTGKLNGNPADLRRQLEAEAVARVDGRTLRRRNRNQQFNVRVTAERRVQIERLSMEHGRLSFVELVERALDVLDELGVEKVENILDARKRSRRVGTLRRESR
jgi:hypothetical protein